MRAGAMQNLFALCLNFNLVLWLLHYHVNAWTHVVPISKRFPSSESSASFGRSYLRSFYPRHQTRNTVLFGEKSRLIFNANFNETSDKLPYDSSQDVYDFCITKECRNHVLSSGGKSVIREIEVDDTLKKLWEEAAETWSGIETSPQLENGDCIIASETSINFPTLKLLNTVYSGVKLVNDINGKPYYTIVSVADKRTPVGGAPVVWLFNKLTGSSNTTTEYSPPGGRAKSYITVEELNDGYVIQFQAKVEIIVEFPSFLVKLLPASKEKLEEEGSASIYKSIDKDIKFAIYSIVDQFQLWKETRSIEVVET